MKLFDNWIKPSDEGTKTTPDIVIIGFGLDDMVNANDTEEGLHDYLSDLAFLTQVHFLSVHKIQLISLWHLPLHYNVGLIQYSRN